MKTHPVKKLILAVLLSALTLVSCEKDNTGGGTANRDSHDTYLVAGVQLDTLAARFVTLSYSHTEGGAVTEVPVVMEPSVMKFLGDTRPCMQFLDLHRLEGHGSVTATLTAVVDTVAVLQYLESHPDRESFDIGTAYTLSAASLKDPDSYCSNFFGNSHSEAQGLNRNHYLASLLSRADEITQTVTYQY